MELNKKNVNQRDLILFDEPYTEEHYCGGCRRFDGVNYDDCVELLNLGVIDPEDQQNEAPPVEDIVKFLKNHPNFKAHGYAISPKRDDYRVSFEGVECGKHYTLEDVWDFFELFTYPDELSVGRDGMRCWFD